MEAKTLTVSINQPAYLPWLGYFERIRESDLHVVLDHVQFEKNSVVNRNKIKTPSGPLWLTVPVQTKGKFGENPINELLIDNQTDWRKKHWKTLSQNYAKAPHFKHYSDFFDTAYQMEWQKINDLNMYFIRFFLEVLNIKTPLVFSSTLSPQAVKSDLVLELCGKTNAKCYLSGVMGRDYLNLNSFKEQGIEVKFQSYQPREYAQLHGPFVGFLSVVDLIFNCGEGGNQVL